MADVGRPLLYPDVETLAAKCEAYFEQCEAESERPMISGLTYFLGFADKTTLYDYRDRPEFSHPVKRAILRVEMAYEAKLDTQAVTGSIFALKNMGWKDKTETDTRQIDENGKTINPTMTIKIVRDTASSITPGDFTPQPAEGTESGEKV